MDLIPKYEFSLGKEPFEVLGFQSEDQMDNEIQKLIKLRPEFDKENLIKKA